MDICRGENFVIERLGEWISWKQGLNTDEAAVFQYGFELLLNSLANLMGVFLIGCLWRKPVESLLFFVCYVFVKRNTGGYHAKSHLSCIAQFNFAYFVLVMFWNLFYVSRMIMCLISIATVISVFLYAPIISRQKSLDEEEIQFHKQKARIKILFLCGIWFLGEHMFYGSYTDFMFLSIAMLEITMLLGRIHLKE